MEDNVSVSKGLFSFNMPKRGTKRSDIYDPNSGSLQRQLWFQAFTRMWDFAEKKLKSMRSEIFTSVLENLVTFVKTSHDNPVTEIPTATLLTGINMPDHSAQFSALKVAIKKNVTPHIAMLKSDSCLNLKRLIENFVYQIVNNIDKDSDDECGGKEGKQLIKKTHCSFALLQSWYESLYQIGNGDVGSSPKKRKTRKTQKMLVAIIPDFEGFNNTVVQDFILIISSYTNILPVVLVLGVATSLSALHRSLPFHVSSKISVQVFHSQPSTVYLNNVVEHVFFSEQCPFHLGGKVFNLLTDIFLFYNLSVEGFIQSYKFAMMQHFRKNTAMMLCCHASRKILEAFDGDDFEDVRRLRSFRGYVEGKGPKERLELLRDDECLRQVLVEEIAQFHKYLNMFHLMIRCLHVLVRDLPRAPLGKQIREIYATAVSTDLVRSKEFKECMQLLGFQSKTELVSKMSAVHDIIEQELLNNKLGLKKQLDQLLEKIHGHYEDVQEATCDIVQVSQAEQQPVNALASKMGRLELKQKLLEMSKTKTLNKYEQMRDKLIECLVEVFEKYLENPLRKPFHEIFFFDDMAIKSYVIGSHRAAIHAALIDPHKYLKCKCCKIKNDDQILPCMPDVCIIYKLYLECGKLINLYDWLQSFIVIVDPDAQDAEEGEEIDVKPEIQARFTQAVADLEFLGFIKTSKRKADHVQRLTWGG